MNYYVYEDDMTDRVRVHTGDCGQCNEGKGKKPSRQPSNRWHGPFDTLTEAEAFAKTLHKKNTGNCGNCLREGKRAHTW